MADFTTLTQLNGFTKDLWTKLKDIFPSASKCVEMFPFDTADSLGGKFKQGIIVQEESGFSQAAPSAGAFTVNSASSMVTTEVYLQGFQTVLQGSIDYESAARASSTKKAYAEIVGKKLANMLESARKRLETDVLYGYEGLGVIASATAASGGKTTLTITAASHAPLLWAGKVGHQVELFTAVDGGTRMTNVAGSFTITAVNVNDATRTVTVLENNSGDAADVKTWVDANPNTGVIFWSSSVSGTATLSVANGTGFNTFQGLSYVSGLSSGALWGLTDISAYDLIVPNQHAVAGALTVSKILDGLSILCGRGYEGDVSVLVHPRAFTNMASDYAMLRRYGGSEEQLKNGAKGLKIVYQGGTATIESYGMVKAGNYFAFDPKLGKRIGAQDISFRRPGESRGPGENIFWDDPTKAGYSYRLYGNQAFFYEEPGRLLKGTGIVNN